MLVCVGCWCWLNHLLRECVRDDDATELDFSDKF